MAVFNAAKREIDIKIVYYGPALCGKTTNVQSIHKKLAPHQRGEMMSFATKDDRTLFFDFLPIELGDVKGFKTRFHLYTVPGQVYYALTRRAVLTGVDGVVFVADSQEGKTEENLKSLKDLNENLKYYKKDLSTLPFIIQYNKMDLDDILSVEELNSALNTLDVPCFASSAIQGTGVMETLTACCKLVLKQMDKISGKRKRPRAAAPSQPEEEADLDEPVIKITSEEPPAEAEVQEPVVAAPEIKGSEEMPSLEPLSSEQPQIPDSAEPEIQLDSSYLSPDLSEPIGPVGEKQEEIGLKDQVSSLKLESEPEPVSVGEPQEDMGLEDQVPSLSLEDEPEPVSVGEPEIPSEAPPVGIQAEPDAGIKIISCGQPQKDSDTSIKVPIVFKIESLDREYTVNITIKFDDFKLKG
jgi:hypothetical protein